MKKFLSWCLLLSASYALASEQPPCCDELDFRVSSLEQQAYGFPFVQPINNNGQVYPVHLAKKPVFLSRVTLLSRLAPTLGPLRVPNVEQFGGIWDINKSDESWIAVNPTNPDNMIIVTHQDASDQLGVFLANIVLYTKDGGKTWQEADVTLSKCQGATLPRSEQDYDSASDPHIEFDKHGNAYMTSVSFNVAENFDEAIVLMKSTDGGATWTKPQAITRDDGFSNYQDRQAVWADPYRDHVLYGVWADYPFLTGAEDAAYIRVSRSVDAGTTWEPMVNAISIIPADDYFPWGAQINVLPDKKHTLVLTTKNVREVGDENNTPAQFIVSRSEDAGQTWKSFVAFDDLTWNYPRDPQDGTYIRSFSLGADTAINPCNGWIYVVSQDYRFAVSEERPGGAIIMMSKDGGLTWSDPIPVNPDTLEAQAFLPTVAVAKDGTVGVLYYDFRYYKPGSPSLDTDVWLARYSEDLSVRYDDIRVTPVSFDTRQFERAGSLGTQAYFPGDYNKLRAIKNDFVASFCVSNPPYGVGPSPVSTDEFTIEQRNRQDVLFARISCDKKGKGTSVDARKWSAVKARPTTNKKKTAVSKIALSDMEKQTKLRGLN